MACVEIVQQISFFSFDFARVTEVRHIAFVFTFPVSKALRFVATCYLHGLFRESLNGAGIGKLASIILCWTFTLQLLRELKREQLNLIGPGPGPGSGSIPT